MTTAAGDNSENVLTLSAAAAAPAAPRSADRRIMFRAFGRGTNQRALAVPFSMCIWFAFFFSPLLSNCIQPFVFFLCQHALPCVHRRQNRLALQTKKKVRALCAISVKTETKNKHLSVLVSLLHCAECWEYFGERALMWHISNKDERAQSIWRANMKRCRIFFFFLFPFFLVHLQTGTPSSDKCFPRTVLKRECKLIWIDVIPGEINARFFFFCWTAAITPLTSIHREICMR